jgi:hypothetical protein
MNTGRERAADEDLQSRARTMWSRRHANRAGKNPTKAAGLTCAMFGIGTSQESAADQTVIIQPEEI